MHLRICVKAPCLLLLRGGFIRGPSLQPPRRLAQRFVRLAEGEARQGPRTAAGGVVPLGEEWGRWNANHPVPG
jgi:hypothetical protein